MYMNNNTRLVEAFGHLEKLCNEIYPDTQDIHGVSIYIKDMEDEYFKMSKAVASWDNDYKCLKEARHKRNLLSHGEVSFDTPCATEDDIDFIVDFRNRILNQTDPISLYRRKSKVKITKDPAKTVSPPPPQQNSSTNKRFLFTAIAIATLTIAALIIVALCFR